MKGIGEEHTKRLGEKEPCEGLHAADESGVPRPPHHAIVDGDGEGATAQLPLCVDLSGEQRDGGGARRRWRRRRGRAGERRRGEWEGDYAGNL